LWDHSVPINLGNPLTNSTAGAHGINNRGEVVGDSLSFDRNLYTPFVWYQSQANALPLPSGAIGGRAFSINDRGEIVGFLDFGSSPPPGTGQFHSVVWTPKGQDYVVTDLGGFEGYFFSVGSHINNRGDVVGSSNSRTNNFHAYLWTGGPLQDLGTLPGGTASEATSNNQRGQVLGDSDRADGNVADFLWQDGIMTDLNDLVPAGTPLLDGNPGGINERGEIAATAFFPDGTSAAFLLTPIH
jgi:probable HAF family extracellular repeat protein